MLRFIFQGLAEWLYRTYPNQWKAISASLLIAGFLLLGGSAIVNSKLGDRASEFETILLVTGAVVGFIVLLLGYALFALRKASRHR